MEDFNIESNSPHLYSEESFEMEAEKKVLEHSFAFGTLSEEKKEELENRLKKWEGQMRVVVHPFFETYRSEDAKAQNYFKDVEKDNPGAVAKKKEIERAFIEMLKMDREKTPPVFIFEEGKYLEKLKDRLVADVGVTMNNDLYIVPTEQEDSMPIEGKGNGHDMGYYGNWSSLARHLKGLGAKKAIIGGMYLGMNQNNIYGPDFSYYEKCVGKAITGLSEKLDVQVSALAYPNSRMDDRKHDGEIKKDNQ